MFTLQTIFNPLLLGGRGWGGGQNLFVEDEKGGKLLGLVSHLRPRIRPLDNKATSMKIYNSNYVYYPRPLLEYARHAEEIFYAILTRAHT